MISPELRARYARIGLEAAPDPPLEGKRLAPEGKRLGYPGRCFLGLFCQVLGVLAIVLWIFPGILFVGPLVMLAGIVSSILIIAFGQVLIYLRYVAHHVARLELKAPPRTPHQ